MNIVPMDTTIKLSWYLPRLRTTQTHEINMKILQIINYKITHNKLILKTNDNISRQMKEQFYFVIMILFIDILNLCRYELCVGRYLGIGI